MSAHKEKMVKLEVTVKAKTAKSALLLYYVDGEDSSEEWVPISTMSAISQRDVEEAKKNDVLEIWLAEWKASQLGWV